MDRVYFKITDGQEVDTIVRDALLYANRLGTERKKIIKIEGPFNNEDNDAVWTMDLQTTKKEESK